MNAQRTQQILRLGCAAMLGLTLTCTADAHRLDEYLQASRISIESGRIVVEITLTPGAAVADGVIAKIDRDEDGEFSLKETGVYAGDVVRSLSLQVDGVEQPLGLERYRFPSPAEMREGLGSIRSYAAAKPPLVAGPPSGGSVRCTIAKPSRVSIAGLTSLSASENAAASIFGPSLWAPRSSKLLSPVSGSSGRSPYLSVSS